MHIKQRDIILRPRWTRRFADSNNNFDVVLRSPEDLDSARMHQLLESIVKEMHRGLTLNGRAIAQFRRFFDRPDTALKSDAYVLLSNWFMTRSGDRNSMVASRCEALWDQLFPCRPLERLSSPAAGKNHIILVSEFQSFWSRVSKAQGEDEDIGGTDGAIAGVNDKPVQPATYPMIESSRTPPEASDVSSPYHPAGQPLTIGRAKAALALTFGVSPDKVEITIRG